MEFKSFALLARCGVSEVGLKLNPTSRLLERSESSLSYDLVTFTAGRTVVERQRLVGGPVPLIEEVKSFLLRPLELATTSICIPSLV
jgi:hypothetical protein